MLFCISPDFGQIPLQRLLTAQEIEAGARSGYFRDEDSAWLALLQHPVVAQKRGSCVRGAHFKPEATHASKQMVQHMWGAVLDVDSGESISLDAAPAFFAQALQHHRHVVWTTFNSTEENPRYRVIVPFDQEGCAPLKFAGVFKRLASCLGDRVSETQKNVDRLGYLPRLPTEEARCDYRCWSYDGPYLNVLNAFGEVEDDNRLAALSSDATPLPSAEEQQRWSPGDIVQQRIKSFFADPRWYADVKEGSRHNALFRASCQLWWDFYCSPDFELQFVADVLLELNSRFAVPKHPRDVLPEVQAGYERVRGTDRVPQTTPAGYRRRRLAVVDTDVFVAVSKSLRKEGRLSTAFVVDKIAVGDSVAAMDVKNGESLKNWSELDVKQVIDAASEAVARHLAEKYAEDIAITDVSEYVQMISNAFEPSIKSTAERYKGGTISIDIVQHTADRVLRFAVDNVNRDSIKLSQEKKNTILIASRGQRETPYTQSEFALWAREQNVSEQELLHSLILVHGHTAYVFSNGTWVEAGSENSSSCFLTVKNALTMAENVGVELSKTDDTKKTLKELIEEYGRPVTNVAYDYTIVQARRHVSHERLTLPIQIRSELRPLYSNAVAGFLAAIGSSDLMEWLWWLPKLQKPGRLLYLFGKKGLAKSTFVHGLGRLWSEAGAKTPEVTVLASFQTEMLNSPLVFCDDYMPVEFSGATGSDRLRSLQQTVTWQVNRKNREIVPLRGAVRLVVAANNTDLIKFRNTLTQQDVDAVLDRLLFVRMPDGVEEYLKTLSVAEWETFSSGDAIAQHVLWLQQNTTVARERLDRFGPIPQVSIDEVVQQTTAQIQLSGLSERLLSFAVARLRDMADGGLTPYMTGVAFGLNRDSQPAILLNRELLEKYWIEMERKPFARKDLVSAFSTVTESEFRYRDNQNKQKRWWSVKNDIVESYVRAYDEDAEELVQTCQEFVKRYGKQFGMTA